MRYSLIFAFLVSFFLLGCACKTPRPLWGRSAPVKNVYHAPADGRPMRRVAFLPIFQNTQPGDFVHDFDSTFSAELTKTGTLEVVPVTRQQLEHWIGVPQIASTGELPSGLLPTLRAENGVDAVLFTELTSVHPYRPVSIGVRSKLVDAVTGEIRWSMDHVFDSGDPHVADAARHFQDIQDRGQSRFPGENADESVLQSPVRFAKYVARETWATLVAAPPSKP